MTARRSKGTRRTAATSGSTRTKSKKKKPTRSSKRVATKARKKVTAKAPRRKTAGKKSGPASKKATKARSRRSTATPSTRIRPFRLARDVRPRSVDLHVEVDPERSTAFRGEVGIEIEIDRRRKVIELHAADLRVTRPRLIVDGRVYRGRAVLHPEKQTVAIEFGESLPKGPARLELHFAGRLRRDLCGLYGATVGERRYAFTQLEAADARKFFPCFDEPAMKARWKLSVTTSSDHAVVSNGPVERTEEHEDGRKTVHFSRTPLLSSYLVALAVGDLESSEPVHAGDTEIRVWHVAGKGGMADFSLEAARETLIRLERYFDLPYPYDKLDLVAVPDFEFGAMENAGAVFFRETLLLIDPSTVTLPEKKRSAEVICHELAHMWYGDLVTMAWWDDLWLNEAFATWMAFHIVDDWQPDWKMWHDFHHHRAAALDLDALEHTHPIYTTVRTPDEANENFDLITYEKGASVVRMIERYLGPEVFRDGVRTYIRRHAESNTVAADLWNALAGASGQAVEAVVRAWIEQEGYPVVRVRRVERDGRPAIELRQERLFEVAPRRAAVAERAAATRWPVPWVGRIGHVGAKPEATRLVRHLLTKRRDVIEATGADIGFVYGNADEGGFFRPEHGAEELRDLSEELGSLSPAERMGLIDHQWALVRSGRAPVASVLDVIAAHGRESDADVLATLRRPLAFLGSRLAPDVGPQCQQRLRAWVEIYFGAQVDEVGLDPRPDEGEEQSMRRAVIYDLVGGIAEATSLVSHARSLCTEYLSERTSIDPNLADSVVSIAAKHGDEALFEAFLAAASDSRTPQEQRRFLMGLCDFREPALIRRSLDVVLGDIVPTQDVAFVLARLLGNRSSGAPTWSFMQKHWTKLSKRMASLLAARVIAATPALATRAARREVARFFKANPVPAGARTLRQALERFDWYDEFRRREETALDDYLHGKPDA